MKSNQLPSQPKPDVETSGKDKPEGENGPTVAEPNIGDETTLNNLKASDVVDDEVLRFRIRKMIDEPPPASALKRLSVNPLVSVMVGFLLTGLLGGFLTHYYNLNQKEIEARRTKEQRESDRLREEQQRELDRRREDERRESDRLRADQQRESDQLYQERQKEFDFQRALQQRETERLRDKRQKEMEYQRSLQQRESEYRRDRRQQETKTQIEIIENITRLLFTYRAAADFLIYDFVNGQADKNLLDKRISNYETVSENTNRELVAEAFRARLYFNDEQLYETLSKFWRDLFEVVDAEISIQIKSQGNKPDSNRESVERWKEIRTKLVKLTNEMENLLKEIYAKVGTTP